MNQREFFIQFKKTLDKMHDIAVKKNGDYALSDDAFKNFELVSVLSGNRVSPEEGLLVRMSDKLQRVTNLLYKKNDVVDERIQDTLQDLANYCIIMSIYLNQK